MKNNSSPPIILEGQIRVPYSWAVGEVGSRFLRILRDQHKLLAAHCSRCATTYLPARKTCVNRGCFCPIDDFPLLEPLGELVTFTERRYASRAAPPGVSTSILGLIRIFGADQALLHLIGEAKLEELSAGMKMEALFRPETKGEILDIAYFRPVNRNKA